MTRDSGLLWLTFLGHPVYLPHSLFELGPNSLQRGDVVLWTFQ